MEGVVYEIGMGCVIRVLKVENLYYEVVEDNGVDPNVNVLKTCPTHSGKKTTLKTTEELNELHKYIKTLIQNPSSK